MAGKKPAIGQTEPRLGGLRIQTSLYGQAVPVVYGRARIPGNLLWYGGFKAERQEERSEAAKGGGSRPGRIFYAYSASVMMLLAEGPITAVRTVYKGKQKFSGQTTTTTAGTAVHTATVPTTPFEVTVPGAAGWVDTVRVTQSVALNTTNAEGGTNYGSGDYALRPGIDYSVAAGVYTFAAALAGQSVTITYTTTAATASVDAAGQLGLALAVGTPGQPVWQYLTTNFSSEAVPYSGFAYLRGQDYPLTSAAEVENHGFEVDGFLQSGASGDARPAAVIADMLTNTAYGVSWVATYLGNWASYSAYCDAYGLLISPAFLEQRAARDWIADLLEATNTDAAWTGRVLKLLPRGEEAAGGYSPSVTPAFALGPDDFLDDDGEMPLQFSRTGQTDVPNIVRVEYANRARDYNYETVASEDEDSIILNGQRPEQTRTWHFFADGQAATNAAQLRRQRLAAVRGRWEFRLPWRFAELEAGDLVTLTDPALSLTAWPVRVLEIEELGDDFSVVAEDFPVGHTTAPVVAPQLGSGFRPDFNVDPGNVAAPLFFEPPGGYTTTGLEVWAALSGQAGSPGAYWGGAEVYASLDGGASYKLVGRVDQGARFGALSTSLASGADSVLNVALAGRGGQLRTVSATEADALTTLCYVGTTAAGEWVAFENATLTGSNTYRLTGLRRGRYGTANQAAASGASFVYVDGAVAMSGPLSLDMIGKPIKFKFCSFNVFGGGLQSLASVTEYTYTPTGRFQDQSTVALSANLLRGTTFDGGVVDEWVPFVTGSSATNTWQRHGDPRYYVAGSPSSAYCTIPDSYSGTGRQAGVVAKSLVAVNPLFSYIAFSGVIAYGGQPLVAVEFFDAQQQLIVGASVTSPVIGGSDANPQDYWSNPTNYGIAQVVCKPPANAAYARMLIGTGGTWLGVPIKYLSIHKPFFGEIPAGARGLPPWDPGAGNAVGTAMLAPGTTSKLFKAQAGFLSFPSGANNEVCVIEFTAEYAGYVAVTGTASGTHQGAGFIAQQVAALDTLVNNSGLPVVVRYMAESRAPGTYSGSATVQQEFDVAPGDTVRIALRVVANTVNATADNPTLRAEYVFR